MRILTGIQSSGKLHIGNYFGAIRPILDRQDDNTLFCFIANLHSLTSVHDAALLRKQTFDAALDWLALGLDPKKTIIWTQSQVQEHTELYWYLSSVCPMGLLERAHSYKDKTSQGISASHGLFSYPVLMAADILLYDIDIVPVGKDQKQHLEIARDLAQKFNNEFGESFVIPEIQISEDVGTVPGTDGKKMSKSYGNTIEIFAEGADLKKSVMSIVTDSTSVDEPKNPETCHVFSIYKLFASPSETLDLEKKYKAGGFGYGDAKKLLLKTIDSFFSEARKRRAVLEKTPEKVHEILEEGAKKAREVASVKMNHIRKMVGMR